jgi:hypothetical protein
VEQDRLSTSAKNRLGAISTLFLVPEKVVEEIDDILTGKRPELPGPEKASDALNFLLFHVWAFRLNVVIPNAVMRCNHYVVKHSMAILFNVIERK